MTATASLSLDLDNEWSYLKTHGDARWERYPTYLDVVVPRVLEFLDKRDLRITFFVIGRDAADDRHHGVLRSIADAGHEIGNHSFHHEPWLHLYTEAELDREVVRAEQAIHSATGQRPVGFRGPGYSLSPACLRVLARRGYRYDATVFPNLLNPLARAYFFRTSKLSVQEKKRRQALFGTIGDALRPVKAFYWRLEDTSLLEIPVTTMPLFKTPIHFSYLVYLSKYSRPVARAYFRFALSLCGWTATEPSLLLHPLDFLGADDATGLGFFPGMDLPSRLKIDMVGEFVDRLAARYDVVTMNEHASRVLLRGKLRSFEPPSGGAIAKANRQST